MDYSRLFCHEILQEEYWRGLPFFSWIFPTQGWNWVSRIPGCEFSSALGFKLGKDLRSWKKGREGWKDGRLLPKEGHFVV